MKKIIAQNKKELSENDIESILQNIEKIQLEPHSDTPWLIHCSKLFHWCYEQLTITHAGGSHIGKTSAESLLFTRQATGCHDVAIVYSYLL